MWEKEFPFSFEEVWINDSGSFAGYAYTTGYDGFGGVGNLVLAVIDKDGEVRAEKVFKREESRHFHAPPTPTVANAAAFHDNSKLILNVAGASSYERTSGFWALDIASAEVAEVELPYAPPVGTQSTWLINMVAIPGTSLIVGQWYEYVPSNEIGTRFIVFDDEFNAVWQESWTRDFSNPSDTDAVQDVIDALRSSGSIVATGSRAFMLRRVDPPELIEYRVSDGGVALAKRVPYDEKLIPKEKIDYVDWPSSAKKTLKVESSLSLATPVSVAQNAIELMPGPGGTLALLTRTSGTVELLLIDQSGKPTARARIAGNWEVAKLAACPIEGGRFLVALTSYETESASLVVVDVTSSAQRTVREWQGRYIDSVAFEDGVVAVLGTIPSRYSQSEFLTAVDLQGKTKWEKIQNGSSNEPGELFSPEDVAVREGEVFVLNNISNVVSVYGAHSGVFLRHYDLESLWRMEPEYTSELNLVSAGFVVTDYSYEDQIVVTGPDFKRRTSFSAKFPDGKTVEIWSGPIEVEDGSYWALSGSSLHRLDSTGKVVQTIGRQQSKAGLTEVYDTKTNGRDRLYASDAETGSVFVYDEDLRLVAECKASPGDFQDYPANAMFDVSNTGNVFVRSFDLDSFIEFSPSGKRLAARPSQPLDDFDGPAHFLAGVGKENTRWYGTMLVDRDHNVVANVGRRHDEEWLGGALLEAPDGTFATLDNDGDTWFCSFHSQDGESRSMATFALEASTYTGSAFDGDYIIIALENALIGIDRSGRPAWQANWPKGDESPVLVGVLGKRRIAIRTAEGFKVLRIE